jgi:hypothetical protein
VSRPKVGNEAERKAMADWARSVRAGYPTRKQLNHRLAQNMSNRLERLITSRKKCDCAMVLELSAFPEYE